MNNAGQQHCLSHNALLALLHTRQLVLLVVQIQYICLIRPHTIRFDHFKKALPSLRKAHLSYISELVTKYNLREYKSSDAFAHTHTHTHKQYGNKAALTMVFSEDRARQEITFT